MLYATRMSAPAPSLRELLMAFAQAFANERFCASCLARKIGTTVFLARRAAAEVAAAGRGVVAKGRCAGCGRRALLLHTETSRPADDADVGPA
jgi:hypothetical protein